MQAMNSRIFFEYPVRNANKSRWGKIWISKTDYLPCGQTYHIQCYILQNRQITSARLKSVFASYYSQEYLTENMSMKIVFVYCLHLA